MSNARSPLFSHFGAALQGITSIRAYGVEDLFKAEALKRVDKYTRSGRTFYNLNRWICIRMDALGGLFASGLAAYMVYYRASVDASDTGFLLNMAVGFSSGIIWWVRIFNDFEVQGNSLERIQDYLSIEQEPESIMVLEAGKIVEFDSPAALLRKESGVFKSLVDESGDRDALYAMAKGQ
ncbi:ATP-dependent bile acid permease OS=Saccharomyces cerevisiae (strain ATCC 204508 / S288c) GN=YBT1 PE=1 SV=2 [Rhizoctonia solani AG-1 IB]|uniref:ATP-dependent bile acid permease n=1 Tax=Thanatephorus cucumeris (strain AG1-IB / isolate 7/3/14) TaxID=1108050 RepID=A0A0B7F492_THACB|nr:ATP-dependent bile acid permease OS=Saccharomyces cerevisiae (strain ATCC 204508 / S288c) GN=YBT1 PE=1 SV=2 [Rhizoctonia solani AG-1 IB]